MADALRDAGSKVGMGGPHITEVPDEPLGRDGGPRHADAIALGEADETWPRIVETLPRKASRGLPASGQGRQRQETEFGIPTRKFPGNR